MPRLSFTLGGLLAASALASPPANGQTCADEPHIPFAGSYSSAVDVSPGGNVVVGYLLDEVGTSRALRWTEAGGTQYLGDPGGEDSAHGVSSSGAVVVGQTRTPTGSIRAFRWTESGGMESLGSLSGTESAALATNADGTVVVGEYGSFPNSRAFRWTESTEVVDLGTLGGSSSRARSVSADGTVIVGSAALANESVRAFRWTSAGGMEDLGTLGGNFRFTHSMARDVSADGTVVVGGDLRDNGAYFHAFRWTASGGMEDLGTLGGNASIAYSVSEDGNVIVGQAQLPSGEYHAFRWTESGGMEDLGEPHFGSGSEALGVSADGSFVVGTSGAHAFRIRTSVMGSTYCRPTADNSTGCGSIILAMGDSRLASGSLSLMATSIPLNASGFFLTSQEQGSIANPGGSQGTLCLGGSIGRFDGPGQIMNSGADGSFTLDVDLTAMPAATLTGFVPVLPGDTWNFQCWYRDNNPGPTSNFTDAVSITFQ